MISADGEQLFMSAAFHRVLGYAERPDHFPAAFVHPDDRAGLEAAFAEVVAGGPARSIQYRVRHADGSWRWVEARGRNRLDDPRIRGVVAVTRDITERKCLEEQLTRLAFQDCLTGLANRALFDDRVRQALAGLRRELVAVVLFFVDLNGFKAVNDRFGHPAGDTVLAGVSRNVAQAVRTVDTVGRWGGDEFVVLCPLTGADPPPSLTARQVSERISAAVETPIQVEGEQITLTASIGWATATSPDAGPAELIRDADRAAYGVKHARTDASPRTR